MSYIDDFKAKMNLSMNLTSSEFMLKEMEKQFKDYLQMTPTKKKIKIENNDTEYLVDIQDVSQINKNNNDEKYCISEYNLQMNIGNILHINDFDVKTWIIIEKENMTIKDRQRYKIRPCNLSLKWISPTDKITKREICAIHSNMSLYSIGMDDNKYFISEDGKRMLTIPMNNITQEIYEGQRFIIGNKVFKISEIFDGNVGLREIKMAQCEQMIGKDDFVNGIAYNVGVNIITPPTTPNYSIQVIGDSDIQVSYPKTYQAKVYNSGVETTDNVIWSIDNPTNASITPSGNSCIAQGLIEGEYVVLACKLQKDNSVTVNKQIYIKGSW